MPHPPCYFCGQIAGRPEFDLIAQMLPGEKYTRRVLWESDSFVAIPSLGPLAEGHVLLCTREHVRSFAAVDPDCHIEYQAMKVRLRRELEAIYRNAALIFEHGMARAGDRDPCTVDHAHMHFVPLGDRLGSDFISWVNWRLFDGSLVEVNRIAAGREYLPIETAAAAPCRKQAVRTCPRGQLPAQGGVA
jgi:diadenosine tetraphosphate (Ap4A) HIT family hydrolase